MNRLIILALLLIAAPVIAEDKVMDIWVTKYALTRGVEQHKGRIFSDGKLAVVGSDYYRNSEFWYTPGEANRQATKMKQQRIDTLVRELKKLQSKEFK